MARANHSPITRHAWACTLPAAARAKSLSVPAFSTADALSSGAAAAYPRSYAEAVFAVYAVTLCGRRSALPNACIWTANRVSRRLRVKPIARFSEFKLGNCKVYLARIRPMRTRCAPLSRRIARRMISLPLSPASFIPSFNAPASALLRRSGCTRSRRRIGRRRRTAAIAAHIHGVLPPIYIAVPAVFSAASLVRRLLFSHTTVQRSRIASSFAVQTKAERRERDPARHFAALPLFCV